MAGRASPDLPSLAPATGRGAMVRQTSRCHQEQREGVKPLGSPLSFENRCLWRRRDCSHGNPRRRALSRPVAGASHTQAGASHTRAGRQEAPTHTRKAQCSPFPRPQVPPNALSVPSLVGVRGTRTSSSQPGSQYHDNSYTHARSAKKTLSMKHMPSNVHTVGIGACCRPATATYRAATKAAVKGLRTLAFQPDDVPRALDAPLC